MLVRQPAVLGDPLASRKQATSVTDNDCKSPAAASACSEDGKGANESSFVFVEASTKTLRRHATVVHKSPRNEDENDCVAFSLLVCEERQALVHDVSLIHPVDILMTKQRMLITNLRIVLQGPCVVVEIPLTSILDLKTSRNVTSGLGLDVKTKDCRFFQLNIEGPEMALASAKQSLAKLLNSIVFSIPPTELYPIRRIKNRILHYEANPFSIDREFARMTDNASTIFKVADDNCDFSICQTYPRKLIVPSMVSKETLLGSSKFRDKGRFPILSWTNKAGTSSIWRSSQPKSSILNRSTDDEDYIRHTGVMYIVDCRPMLNAYANIANGAGVESLGNYHKGIELWFAGIQNIHHVRESWEKIFLLAQHYYATDTPPGTTGTWFSGLDNSGWLDLMSTVLRAASVVVEKISAQNISVLCRCSHGLDRTPQVCSLAMIALDPYYRTIEGFAVLVEKEWISLGHRFHSRYCIGQHPHDDVSPIFSQWVECVYQLLVQFPDEFEFTSDYLLSILFGALSGRFGNFLFDCEKERLEHGSLSEDGAVADSIWPVLWNERISYANFNFEKRARGGILKIEHRASKLNVFAKLWLSHVRINFP
jgi:hypothetical protein